MALKTLNYKIFRLVAGLLCLTSFATLLFVWLSTTNQVEIQLSRDLGVAKEIFDQSLKNTESQLYNSAKVLTADFGFKQAVATNDRGTIESVLKNHSERISADLMTLISLDGKVISSTSKAFAKKSIFPDQALVESAINQGGVTSFIVFDEKLYQVILLTVDAPRTIAIAQLGFEIDLSWAEKLKNIIKLDIIVNAKKSTEQLTISTLNKINTKVLVENESINTDPGLIDSSYLAKSFTLFESEDTSLTVILAEDSRILFSELYSLQYKIFITTLLAIIISLFSVAVFSKNLTLPLSLLASRTSQIASGKYSDSLEISANTEEINNLVDSFDRMQSGIKHRQEKIAYNASHDLLTGLYNRGKISELINEKLLALESFGVLGFNINDFRSINDTFGYSVGDVCIATVAERIKKMGGVAARLNGSEMILITDLSSSDQDLLSIKRQLEKTIELENIDVSFNVSVCQLQLPRDADTVEQLLRRNSLALDRAKQRPSHYINYSEELERDYLERLNVLMLLKNALTYNMSEFTMVYQPKLHYLSNSVVKSEALIRWHNEQIGFVSPELFIPIAEQAGLIHNITYTVITHVINDLKSWAKQGISHQVAINLSVHDIDNLELLPWILNQLKKSKLPRSALSFEITESGLMKDPVSAGAKLMAYRQAGFNLSIDDFGTGYSSLSYLKNMPINELKIDKSFVMKMDTEQDDQKIVKTILSLANSFDLEVVAEGIESQVVLSMLESWGCHWAQGYHISRPMPASELTLWLEKNGVKYA